MVAVPVAVLNVVKPTLAVAVAKTLLGSIELLLVADEATYAEAVTAAVERAVVDAVVPVK